MIHCHQTGSQGTRQIRPVQPGSRHASPPEGEGREAMHGGVGIHVPKSGHQISQRRTSLVAKIGLCVHRIGDTIEVADHDG